MGHIAAAADDDDYTGLSFDETLRRVREKGEREKFSEEKVTDWLTKIVVERFVWYHVGKPKREYLWSKNNGEFADPLGRIHQKIMGTPSQAMVLNISADHADKKGIKRPISQCPKREEGGEKKGEKRPKKSMIAKKSNVEKKQKKKDQKTNRFNLAELGLEPPPGLPEGLKRLIEEKGGTETTLVIMKQLFKTDMSRHHDRFSMPLSQMREGLKFLTEGQIELLENSDESNSNNKKEYVPVNLLEPGPDHKEKRGLALRRWNSNCVCYMITTKWHEIVQNNNLKENDILQVWSFRVGEDLWFAIVKVMDCEEAWRRTRAGGCGGHHEKQENGVDGTATSSSHGGDQGSSGGDDGEPLQASAEIKLCREPWNCCILSPDRDEEDCNGATTKDGGPVQD